MTSADTSATAYEPSMAEPRRWTLRRLFVPLAVGLAALTVIAAYAIQPSNTARLTNALVVLNSIVLVIALVAVTIYTKLQLS